MEDEQGQDADASLHAMTLAREEEVMRLLKANTTKAALIKALENPPTTAKNLAIKEKNAAVVQSVLSQVPEAQIDSTLEDLGSEMFDVLIKYVYRLLATSSANSQALLRWHEKIVASAGLGSIIRALADRKTV